MSEIRELIDTELDAVCGGHHHHHHHHHGHYGQQGQQGQQGLFEIVNFGNIVIEQNIAVQIGVAVGANASVTNLLGSQTNLSSITTNLSSIASDPLTHASDPLTPLSRWESWLGAMNRPGLN